MHCTQSISHHQSCANLILYHLCAPAQSALYLCMEGRPALTACTAAADSDSPSDVGLQCVSGHPGRCQRWELTLLKLLCTSVLVVQQPFAPEAASTAVWVAFQKRLTVVNLSACLWAGSDSVATCQYVLQPQPKLVSCMAEAQDLSCLPESAILPHWKVRPG